MIGENLLLVDNKPVLALDIDGVLNPRQPPWAHAVPPDSLHDYRLHNVTFPASDRRLPFFRGDGLEAIDDAYVWLSPTHARWIESLHTRHVEVAWCTTWQHFANEVAAPLLGIEPLPLAVEFDVDIERGHYRPTDGVGSAPQWKRDALMSRYRGRPLAWIDDDPLSLDGHDAPHLVIECAAPTGLTAEQMQRVNGWLDQLGWPSA